MAINQISVAIFVWGRLSIRLQSLHVCIGSAMIVFFLGFRSKNLVLLVKLMFNRPVSYETSDLTMLVTGVNKRVRIV